MTAQLDPALTPAFHLTYAGDHSPTVGKLIGPDMAGAFFGVVSCDFDPIDGEKGRSRVGLVHIDSDDTMRAVRALAADPEGHAFQSRWVHCHDVPTAIAFCRICARGVDAA